MAVIKTAMKHEPNRIDTETLQPMAKVSMELNQEKVFPVRELGGLESMVVWIEQDSTSQANRYLEECNTHQAGE